MEFNTNFAAELKAEKLKIQLALENDRKRRLDFNNGKKMIKLSLKCSWCGDTISNENEDHFYFCDYHNCAFCDYCAKNYYKKEIPRNEAPKCKMSLIDGHECIYQRKEIL